MPKKSKMKKSSQPSPISSLAEGRSRSPRRAPANSYDVERMLGGPATSGQQGFPNGTAADATDMADRSVRAMEQVGETIVEELPATHGFGICGHLGRFSICWWICGGGRICEQCWICGHFGRVSICGWICGGGRICEHRWICGFFFGRVSICGWICGAENFNPSCPLVPLLPLLLWGKKEGGLPPQKCGRQCM